MSQMYLHCKADGTALLDNVPMPKENDVSVLPYTDGLKVVIRVTLSSGSERCAIATVPEMAEGETKSIADITKAGQGATVVNCELKPNRKRKVPVAPPQLDEVVYTPSYLGVDDDFNTPAELWVSGMKNVPSALPDGGIAFLIMRAEWYDMIESGEKRAEWRKQCKKYKAMFLDHKPVAVRLQYGFTPRQMVWEIDGVEDNKKEGIVIYLGKRIQ